MKSPAIKNADYISESEKGNYGPLTVMHSGAGWYVGTYYTAPDGFVEPGSRDSDYFRTEKEAAAHLKLMEASEGVPGPDLSAPELLYNFMSASQNEADWNARCITVKAQFGGNYPNYWFKTIIQSGLMQQLGLDGTIRIHAE